MIESIQKFFTFLGEVFASGITLIFGEIDFSVFSYSQVVIDILSVTLLTFVLLKLIARVHAFRILFTALIFAILLFISQNFNLHASQIILQGILILILVSVPLMFQQELRKFFEKFISSPLSIFKKYHISQKHKLVKSVKQAAEILAEKQQGAIIAIEKANPLDVYSETGTPLQAEISKELILNIFFPKSPLHDGAIIVRDTTILSAGCVLPLTQTVSEYIYGTRHKSALGLSEATDAIIIVVSEERGEISIAHEGELNANISLDYLEDFLNEQIK